ncbi:MAG: hypothetical protein IPN44_00150 [Flavobacteriales bacterium]|nr:hypothetical protein [Flavobacteriales bacterium]
MDNSSLNQDDFTFKLNGFRTVHGMVDLKRCPPKDMGQFTRISHWVYAGGVTIDKIGLARNIISLHLLSDETLDLRGHPYDAILSGYKIYEKQNIKTYIDLRAKVTEQLIDFNHRATKIVEDFAAGFQRGSIAILSFYATTLVIKVISKGDLQDLFNTEITVLSLTFLTASVLYFFVCRWEVKQQRNRFISSYQQMKARQADILDKEDVKRILNDDAEHTSNVRYIDNKVYVYKVLWIAIISLLGVATLLLYTLGTCCRSVQYYCNKIPDWPLGTFTLLNEGH